MAKHRWQPVGADPVYGTILGAARRLTIGVPPLRRAINSRVIPGSKITAGTNVPRAQRAPRCRCAWPGPGTEQKPPKACCLRKRRFWTSNRKRPSMYKTLALVGDEPLDRKSTRLNSSHSTLSRMPSSA